MLPSAAARTLPSPCHHPHIQPLTILVPLPITSEVTEGMGPRCPLIWDAVANASRPETPEEGCVAKEGLVSLATCDTKNQAWCRQGVVSYHR